MSRQIIENLDAGQRLDKALATALPEYSRATLEKMINLKLVWVDGGAKDTKYKVKAGDKVEIDLSKLLEITPEIDIPVIYQDENVVVINKPIGLLAHSKGTFNNEATVATWLNANYADKSKFWSSNRAGIVHRLDRATSGVMICAKNQKTQTHLQKQFANRNVKKAYLAVIVGELPEHEGLIDVPIERNPKKPATFRAGANGKSARTEFKVISSNHNYSLVELKPRTGRTHQLRVHLSYLQHPIVGDDFYDGQPAKRLMLHAKSLELTLPGGIRKTFEAEVPSDLLELM